MKPNAALLKHPLILASLGAVVLIAAGSTWYYVSSTRVPTVQTTPQTSASAAVTGSGVVSPAENPDLAFAGGGRVASVRAKVGDKVYVGEVLASLDSATLAAQRAQAAANVLAAQARLAELTRGARSEDVAAKQTALDLSNSNLANLYTNAATTIEQTYDKSFSGISQYTDTLFNNPNTSNPSLVFSIADSQLGLLVVQSRVSAQGELSAWQKDATSLSSNPSRSQIEAAIPTALAHLNALHVYADQLIAAIGSSIPTTNFPQSSVSAAQTAVGIYRDALNTSVTALQSSQQQIASAKLAVQSAQDALTLLKAGSTPEAIAAQEAAVAAAEASVASVDAQIRNNIVVAPFAGTVASVHVKVGDIVPANTKAIALNPVSALQVTVYFSEIDISKISVGENASVTLDAYGEGRRFSATVVSVDAAPTTLPNGATGYKATLQFAKSDPAITAGMVANITI